MFKKNSQYSTRLDISQGGVPHSPMPGHVTPTANQIRTDLSSSLNVRRKLDLDGHVPPGGFSDAVVGDAVVRPAVLLLHAVDLQNVASVLEITKLTLVIKQSLNGDVPQQFSTGLETMRLWV